MRSWRGEPRARDVIPGKSRQVTAVFALAGALSLCAACSPGPGWSKSESKDLPDVELTPNAPTASVHFAVESSRPVALRVTGTPSVPPSGNTVNPAVFNVAAALSVEGGNDLGDFAVTVNDNVRSSDLRQLDVGHSAGPGGFGEEEAFSGPLRLRDDCYPCRNDYVLTFRVGNPSEDAGAITFHPFVRATIAGNEGFDDPPRAYVRILEE